MALPQTSPLGEPVGQTGKIDPNPGALTNPLSAVPTIMQPPTQPLKGPLPGIGPSTVDKATV